MLTKNEKKRIRKIRRNSILSIIFIMVLGVMLIRNNFFSFNKGEYAHAIEVDKKFIDNMVLNNPVVEKVDEDLIKKKEAEIEKELMQRREQIRIQEEKMRAEQGNRKIAYLTFDDGPSRKSTPKILDILKEEDVPATFFILGQMADTNPDILKRVYDEGHAIGHHSYTHNYGYLYSSPDHFMGELEKTSKTFKNILGDDFETKLMRLPGGAFGEKKQRYVNIAAQKGYINYNWNALNGDSEGHNKSVGFLVNRLKNTVGNQREVVILMHDTDAKSTTVQALPESIRYLKSQGYEFRKLEIGDN